MPHVVNFLHFLFSPFSFPPFQKNFLLISHVLNKSIFKENIYKKIIIIIVIKPQMNAIIIIYILIFFLVFFLSSGERIIERVDAIGALGANTCKKMAA